MQHKNTATYATPIQLKLPVDLKRIIKISDSVYAFNEVVFHIDLNQYFARKERKTGRPEYDRETLFKLVLFAFMEFGYCSVRQLHKLCDTDMRCGINGLAAIVEQNYHMDLCGSGLFLFCGRCRDRIKALLWACYIVVVYYAIKIISNQKLPQSRYIVRHKPLCSLLD